MRVLYAEGHGEAAEGELRRLLARLRSEPGFLGGELLVSPAQPGLALVQTRWSGDPPGLDPIAGLKVWVFEVVESV